MHILPWKGDRTGRSAVEALAELFAVEGGPVTGRFLLIAGLCAGAAFAQSSAPLQLEKVIPLTGVKGRIDHMSFDPRTHRLFVAALGNNTVEIIDTSRARRVYSIRGLDEPQGVLFLSGEDRLYVANGGDGTLRIFDGASYRPLGAIHLGSDADNIRFDSARRLIYVGYGSGALAAVRTDGTKTAIIKLDAHPESFQIEENGPRIFVNLPDLQKLGVIDKRTGKVVADWKTGGALANFPMALDESDQRLFIACRRPAKLIVLDTNSGKLITTLPAVGDCDDLFYDSRLKRIYATGGEGAVSVFQQQAADHYTEIARIPTRRGARTSFFSLRSARLFLAARQQGSQSAAIYIYSVRN